MLQSRSSSTSLLSISTQTTPVKRTRATMAEEQSHRRWTIFLFSITTLLLFADQNLMAPSLTEIAEEFGFDEEERDRKLGGDISLAFFLLGAPASMVLGCLADSRDRSIIFAWTVFIGEGACLATYWVQTYPQLYVCRAITGFSVGGAVPLIYSVLGDLFAAEDRHMVSSLVSFGTGAGIAVGQAIAGFLAPVYGWRLPFLVVALPALTTALLVLFTVSDPERGAMEPSHVDDDSDDGVALVSMPTKSAPPATNGSTSYSALSSPPSTKIEPQRIPDSRAVDDYFDSVCDEHYGGFCCNDIKVHFHAMMKLLSTPTVVLAVLQGAPGCVTWGVINVFLNDFLAEDRGFTIQAATTTLMFFSLGHAVGLFLVGGGLAQRVYRMDRRYPALVAGVTAIGGCVPLWLLFNHVDSTTPYAKVILITALAGFGSGPTGPIIKATLTNVTLPRARGQAFAFFNLFDDFGKGLGPFFVSLLISGLGGRLVAFNIAIWGWAICGMANLAIYFFVEQDEARMQAELALRVERDLSV